MTVMKLLLKVENMAKMEQKVKANPENSLSILLLKKTIN